MAAFRLPTRVDIAPGASQLLPTVVRQLELDAVLLVYDHGLRATEWPERLHGALSAAGIRAERFDEVGPNPRTTTAERAAEVVREEGLGGVVGVGGGSVLDAAKAAAMLAANDGRAAEYEGKDVYSERPLPFVAVPSTCGTGSEVTWVSVLTDEATHRKISVKGETMFPDRALVDAELLRTLPAELVAWTGLDALTHALEATTGRLANPASDALAEKAVALLFRYLPRAAADIAGDGEARREVMRAATLAGMAFGNADVGAVHCLSETLGGLWDVPHGLANAILLAPVLASHRPAIDRRLAELLPLVTPDPLPAAAPEAERAAAVLDALDALLRRLDTPAFASLGVAPEDHRTIAERAVENGSNDSNPRPMGVDEYLAILARCG